MDISPSDRLTIGLGIALVVLCLLKFVLGRWTSARQTRKRAEFAQRLAGIEHSGGARPGFGYFPEQDHFTPPFHWAIEFTRSGCRVLVYEVRTVTTRFRDGDRRRKTHQRTYVQVAVPPCPPVTIGPKDSPLLIIDEAARAQLVDGTPADSHGLYVSSPDPEFARALVTDRLAAAIAAQRKGRWAPTVTFERGTLRGTVPHLKFEPEIVLRNTDFLIGLLRHIPADVWQRVRPPQA